MIQKVTASFGSDPEGFLAKDGAIVGSEKLVPEKGKFVAGAGTIVRDGVQFELNPYSGSIRELQRRIGELLNEVFTSATDKGLGVVLDGVVEVSRKELDSLSPGCRVLGCMPSYNAYGNRPITVDPVTYRKRSSGGHIHVGLYNPDVKSEIRRIAPLFDILVGLPSVLLDRDPGAAERRENYGRAGEFRLPSHGFEYRTTSNFWLRDPALMHFVFGMAELTVSIFSATVGGDKIVWNTLAEAIDIKDVTKAIDTNDYKNARKQFLTVYGAIQSQLPKTGFPLSATNLDAFLALADLVNKKGIETVFPYSNVVRRWQTAATFDGYLKKL